jgi:DNA ligase-1
VQLSEIVRVSGRVLSTTKRSEKVSELAAVLGRLEGAEVAIGVAYLSGLLPQGRIGVGPAAIQRAFVPAGATDPSLTIGEVHETLDAIRAVRGAGSGAERIRLLHGLFTRATGDEQRFLMRLLLGELRQGAQEGVMLEALARAADAPASSVRRAVMLAGKVSEVAPALLLGGASALDSFSIRVFRPVKPMLADSASSLSTALDRLGRAALEYKIDGARVQAHKRGRKVRIFTRRSNDETGALPELVELVRSLPVDEVVLDGEAVALRPNGRPRPFQETMRRFGRVADVQPLSASLPLTPFFFDCLYLNGTPLIDAPASERWSTLASLVPGSHLVERLVTEDTIEAERFFHRSREAGHEGVIAKDPEAVYMAGRRGRSWLKVKPVHTLDLVVLAAEWGHGRRTGRLSNLHLGARDPSTGAFVMVGKTFKGLTDALLEWQTERLLALAEERSRHVVRVRPELVVEIAFDGVQRSPRYPGGVALRFARVKGYREDKSAAETDTIDSLRDMLV